MIDITTWKCGPPPKTGRRQQYPSRFLLNLQKVYPEVWKDSTLHMFCGAFDGPGITTDALDDTDVDLVCPFDEIPLCDGSIEHVVADPPYASHYAEEWGEDLPKPKHILREAVRLIQPGGLILILHIIVIPAYRVYNVERVALHPILCGSNNAIRVLNVFRKK